MRADADIVKDALADVLGRRHPDHLYAIERAEYEQARRFLSRFDGSLYTVNYDLLLYWTLVQNDIEPAINTDDGFRADEQEPDAPYVVWDPYAAYKQRVFFLHGGLHLFDAGAQLKKVTSSPTGIHVVEQIRAALTEGLYPRVVTEATTEEKQAAILHSAYLAEGLKSLTACGGALFVYGHSLAESDAHILRCISNGKVRQLYVSVYGDPDAEDNRLIQDRAWGLAHARPESKPLSVDFFDAASAQVWAP